MFHYYIDLHDTFPEKNQNAKNVVILKCKEKSENYFRRD